MFAARPSADTGTDLNRQLWCCVRTAHVETTLRLIAQGADTNYEEAGARPLHIAAKEGQQLQVDALHK
jgi:G protein-coupled receptor kinase interacting protein 2